MRRGTNYINPDMIADGAFTERLNAALLEVAENIQDPNTDAKAKRKINISLTFSPNKSRTVSNVVISVNTKLAPKNEIETQIAAGIDPRTGAIEIAECNHGIPGQISMTIDDNTARVPEPDAQEETERQARRPIDLRNRTKSVQGFDPETGEIYDTRNA